MPSKRSFTGKTGIEMEQSLILDNFVRVENAATDKDDKDNVDDARVIFAGTLAKAWRRESSQKPARISQPSRRTTRKLVSDTWLLLQCQYFTI